jgi:hypothetical protein
MAWLIAPILIAVLSVVVAVWIVDRWLEGFFA